MSRSRRRQPIVGITTTRTERPDKQIWHGRMRAHERAATAAVRVGDQVEFPQVREVSDPWAMGKDGKKWMYSRWFDASDMERFYRK